MEIIFLQCSSLFSTFVAQVFDIFNTNSILSARFIVNTRYNIVIDYRYMANAKRLSRLYQDRDLDPMDTAVYWIEYLARHRESLLAKPAVPNRWYEQHLIDVAVTMVVTTAAAIYLTKRVLGKCYRTIAGR